MVTQSNSQGTNACGFNRDRTRWMGWGDGSARKDTAAKPDHPDLTPQKHPVLQTINPSIQEADAVDPVSSRPAWSTY